MQTSQYSSSDLSELAKLFKQQTQNQLAAQKEQSGLQLGSAGIQAGATLLSGLMRQKAEQELNTQQLQTQLIREKTQSDVENIAKANQLQRNALTQLMSNYRAALV